MIAADVAVRRSADAKLLVVDTARNLIHTPRVVDAILSGTHEPGTSHYQLLRAFLEDSTLQRATEELIARGYKTHKFGDSILIL